MTCYDGVEIRMLPGVYEPAEDTFLLAKEIDARPGERVLDMGTGSGLLGLIAARKGASVLAVDINPQAVECAQRNARLNGLEDFHARRSDLFSGVEGRFDLIIFNPPYLPTEEGEPRDLEALAWDGGSSGREVIDRFLRDVRGYLLPGGRVLMLGSSLSGHEKTAGVLRNQGFCVSPLSSLRLDFEELVVIRAVYDL
ncbi:MAG: methyltransferase domain-containing protein [Methanobacteriota archaeon]|nr:MAG: methyltransferase domain-containing protein [Euryarchaeota archaeon]